MTESYYQTRNFPSAACAMLDTQVPTWIVKLSNIGLEWLAALELFVELMKTQNCQAFAGAFQLSRWVANLFVRVYRLWESLDYAPDCLPVITEKRSPKVLATWMCPNHESHENGQILKESSGCKAKNFGWKDLNINMKDPPNLKKQVIFHQTLFPQTQFSQELMVPIHMCCCRDGNFLCQLDWMHQYDISCEHLRGLF